MKDQVKVCGIILSVYPIGENDRRLTILTKERGKIQVFARGCRKPNHPLFGVTQPLIFCEFMLTEGRSFNYLNSAEGKEYFPSLKTDLDMIYYSSYFAELAEYFTVEGMDERNILNLLYVTFKAMERRQMTLPLIRRIYEYRILQYYGIGLEVFHCLSCGSEEEFPALLIQNGGVYCSECIEKMSLDRENLTKLTPSLLYTLQYVSAAPLGRLYSFKLSEEAFAEFSFIVNRFLRAHVPHQFRSGKMLEML